MARSVNVSFRNTLLLFFALGSFASSAHGSGYGVFTQGASALGQADSVVAHTDGPSTLFFNPALMNKLPGTQVEIGTTLLMPTRSYKDANGSTTNTQDTVFTPSTFYLTHTFNDKISAGLAVFNPFGLGTDWGGEWGGATPASGWGRYIATKSELTTWDINPAVSYRILPALSIAAGLDIVLLDATLENKIYTPYGDISQKFKGSGNGIGYNFGLSLDAGGGVTLGASYRSQVQVDINGDLNFGLPNPALSPYFPHTSGSSSLTLPQQLFAGVAYQRTDAFSLEAGMRWEDWSSFKELRIVTTQPIGPTGATVFTYPRDWQSTYAFNLGGTYKVNETFSIMAGYLHGWNPVPDNTFDPSIPDSDTNLYTLGGEARYKGVTLALSYGYQMQTTRYKSDNAYAPSQLNTPANATGTYKTDLHLVGLSLGYKF